MLHTVTHIWGMTCGVEGLDCDEDLSLRGQHCANICIDWCVRLVIAYGEHFKYISETTLHISS